MVEPCCLLLAQDQAENVELVGKRRWSCLAFVSRKVRLPQSAEAVFQCTTASRPAARKVLYRLLTSAAAT